MSKHQLQRQNIVPVVIISIASKLASPRQRINLCLWGQTTRLCSQIQFHFKITTSNENYFWGEWGQLIKSFSHWTLMLSRILSSRPTMKKKKKKKSQWRLGVSSNRIRSNQFGLVKQFTTNVRSRERNISLDNNGGKICDWKLDSVAKLMHPLGSQLSRFVTYIKR